MEAGRTGVTLAGFVAPGFEAVRDAFAENLETGRDLGAAFALTHEGRPVVDLYGGIADSATGAAWTDETLQVIYSGTKGLVALALLMLVDRGQLDLNAPVARVWPEFAAHGKGDIRIIDLATHRARLPRILTNLSEADITDDSRMASLLAAQPVDSDPRAGSVYHAYTYGWLCGEVIRRVDGRSVGRFFADEVARPLDLDIWIGLPPEHERRVSRLDYSPEFKHETWDRRSEAEIAGEELYEGVWLNPPLFAPDHVPSNRQDWHQAEIPAISGIASARSLARLYGCLACGGTLDGVSLLSTETLRMGRIEQTRRHEPLLDRLDVFAVGFRLQTDLAALGPPADAFGHTGAGGSVHCAWPNLRAGVSYAMNRLRDDPVDTRSSSLLRAAHISLVSQGAD
jgi:CubicO group peptidase (beta-lactamase class C family)